MDALAQKHSSSATREDMVCLGVVFGAAGVRPCLGEVVELLRVQLREFLGL